METKPHFSITREKHLDHMVRVVPLIVLCYAFQCYVIVGMKNPLSSACIFVLGGCLIAMISAFLTYDLKHQVHFFDDHFEMNFLHMSAKVAYADILSVEATGSEFSFGKVIFRTRRGTFTCFFVDDTAKITEWMNSRNQKASEAA